MSWMPCCVPFPVPAHQSDESVADILMQLPNHVLLFLLDIRYPVRVPVPHPSGVERAHGQLVPGSPMDWAAMMPTASPISTLRLVDRSGVAQGTDALAQVAGQRRANHHFLRQMLLFQELGQIIIDLLLFIDQQLPFLASSASVAPHA